jgi:hypothetical protein
MKEVMALDDGVLERPQLDFICLIGGRPRLNRSSRSQNRVIVNLPVSMLLIAFCAVVPRDAINEWCRLGPCPK